MARCVDRLSINILIRFYREHKLLIWEFPLRNGTGNLELVQIPHGCVLPSNCSGWLKISNSFCVSRNGIDSRQIASSDEVFSEPIGRYERYYSNASRVQHAPLVHRKFYWCRPLLLVQCGIKITCTNKEAKWYNIRRTLVSFINTFCCLPVQFLVAVFVRISAYTSQSRLCD